MSTNTFCSKRTKQIVLGKLRVPEGTHKGVMEVCAKHGYSKASDAVIFLLNTALSVTGHLPGFEVIKVETREQSGTGAR